jgi:hypothetical protein
MNNSTRCALAITIMLATTSVAVDPSLAGPFPLGSEALRSSAPSDVVMVRNRRGAIIVGAALGLIGAAIVASAADRYYYDYYGPVYYYPPFPPYPPLYYPPYAYYGPYWGAPVWSYGPHLYTAYGRYRPYAYRPHRLRRHVHR